MKRYILSSLILLLIMFGCSPKGDPKDTINNYYQALIDGNFDTAYELLSDYDKDKINKDDFILYQNLNRELMEFTKFKTNKIKELKNESINGKIYKHVVEFTVTETSKVYNDRNKELAVSSRRKVVNDNGVWRLLRDYNNIKELIADDYSTLGYMYAEGKGKEKNLLEAANSFKMSIKTYNKYYEAYYGLAYVYSNLERYDDSNDVLRKYINGAKEKSELSDAYNLLGSNYAGKGNYINAKLFYSKANNWIQIMNMLELILRDINNYW